MAEAEKTNMQFLSLSVLMEKLPAMLPAELLDSQGVLLCQFLKVFILSLPWVSGVSVSHEIQAIRTSYSLTFKCRHANYFS